ncbi:MAG: NTP transferase domain-containing protein [Myxococcales bacterium]|nr:NTP transferase domain-containing protein [Myxococcales bacterium]
MERAIILAAGLGQRLVDGKPYPKPLQPVNGVPLIVRVLRSLEHAGVKEVAIVIGHLGDVLIEGLRKHRFDLEVRFVWNREFHKPNGTSLLKAKDFVAGPTYLLMSDHLFSPELIRRVRRYPLALDEAVLGVDFKIGACFDLPDATKVAIAGDRVREIGKELPRYQALDTGVFRITPAVIEALERAEGPDGCSLSDGIGELASKGRMRVVDVEDAAWIDVDTPDAHTEAERLLSRYGQSLCPMPAAAARRRAAAMPAE